MLTRVTSAQMTRLVYRNTASNLSRMSALQNQLSTGYRINAYADDPQAVGLTRRYEALIRENSQYADNIVRARVMIDQSDQALLDIAGLLRDARALAQQGANGSSSAETNRILAASIDSIIEQGLYAMNQSVEGNAIFGGFRTDTSPFVMQNGTVLYQGDQGIMGVQIGPSTVMDVNIPGNELLGGGEALLSGYGDMAHELWPTDPLDDIGYGAGWNPGMIAWTDASGVELQLDLTGAGTIQDVLDLLNAAGLNATRNADLTGLTITDPAGGPLTIRDLDGSDTALSLGIVGTASDGVIEGSDIRVGTDWSTNLGAVGSLLGGALPLGSIRLTHEGTSLDIDLSAAGTLDDVRNLFENAIAAAGLSPLTMELSGQSLNVSSASGAVFSIDNLSGDQTANNLGITGTGSPKRLFGVLEDLRDALLANDQAGIHSAQDELSALEDHIMRLEVGVGGRQNMLDWMEGLNAERDGRLQSNLASIRDVDLIEVSSELSAAESAYQASLLVSSKMMQMNLFDYL
jgi:flagellar hook-associated protein 3 FlgL